MHDFMQSLQMRCPVAAHMGLSIVTIASAPIGFPFLLGDVHLGDLLVERAAVQGDAEHGLFELARLLTKPGGTRVLHLVVALDAIVTWSIAPAMFLPDR